MMSGRAGRAVAGERTAAMKASRRTATASAAATSCRRRGVAGRSYRRRPPPRRRHRDAEREAIDIAWRMSLADAVALSRADPHHAAGSRERSIVVRAMRVRVTHLDAWRCERVPAGARTDSRPHGALGPVRATPRMPPPPGLPPTPEERPLRSKYYDSTHRRHWHKPRVADQRPRLVYLLRESVPLPLPPKHQFPAQIPKRRSLQPTTTPPRSTLRSRASRASTSASPRCSLSACRTMRCLGSPSSARARRSETRTPWRRSRGCVPSSTWARR